MKRTSIVFALALLAGASSCSSCESCKGSPAAGDGAATSGTSTSAEPTAPTGAPASASLPPMDPNFACRTLARAITSKACECPQKNKVGCCFYGAPGIGAEARPPFVSCSGGKTDWPTTVEDELCKVGKQDDRRDLLMGCYAAKEKLRCGRTEGGDVGVEVPKECETLLKEAQGIK